MTLLTLPLCLLILLTSCGGSPETQSTSLTIHQTPLPKGPITYIALGASDAVGVGSKEPGSQGYVPLLAQKLPKGSHVVNLGISGIHLKGAIDQELPIATTSSPDLVTIWLVANDFIGGVSYDSYMHDLDRLLSELKRSTHARIVMANLPDLTKLPLLSNQSQARKAQIQQTIQRWNTSIDQTAKKYDVTVVDLYSHNSQITAHPEYISGDGFHPSPAGYVQLANYFWETIK